MTSRFLSGVERIRLHKAKTRARSWLRSRNIDTRGLVQDVDLATYWHGTGRFQYRFLGESKYDGIAAETTDVLANIISQGGLTPHYDPFIEVAQGYQTSTSLAFSRVYARAYAGYHQHQDMPLKYEYGSAAAWFSLFGLRLGPTNAIKIFAPYFKRNKRERPTVDAWLSTVRKPTARNSRGGVLAMRSTRSDISDNHGILFGIKAGAFTEVETPPGVRLTEVRANTPIRFDQMTHVEVPLRNVAEVRSTLTKAGIHLPVHAMEDVEAVSSRWSMERKLAGHARR